jgi:hypothetical protein
MHDTTTIGGFAIPSSDPLFLGVVAIHVLLGIAAAAAGLVAMLHRAGIHEQAPGTSGCSHVCS